MLACSFRQAFLISWQLSAAYKPGDAFVYDISAASMTLHAAWTPFRCIAGSCKSSAALYSSVHDWQTAKWLRANLQALALSMHINVHTAGVTERGHGKSDCPNKAQWAVSGNI